MARFQLKSIVLGIGIGMILTAVSGIIYSAGADPMQGVTKEQIIEKAEQYGMVQESILQQNSGNQDQSTKK